MARIASLLGLMLLLAATWMYPVGTWQLQPPASMVAHPESWSELPSRAGLFQMASLALIWMGLLKNSGSLLAAWLGSAAWLGWASQRQGFWLCHSPEQAQQQAVIAFFASLSLFLGASPDARRGWLPALLLVPALARLGPVWPGAAGLLWLLLLTWGSPRLRGFVACQGALWLCGIPHSYVLWAALASTLAVPLARAFALPSSQEKVTLAWKPMAALAAVVLSLYVLKPGEEHFNRDLLLAAQKARQPLASLLRPQPLDQWVTRLGDRLQMNSGDVALADWLRSQPLHLKVMVLTPGAPAQSLTVRNLLTQLSGGRPLSGWLDDELSPAARHALATRRYRGCGLDCVILRGPHEPLDLPVALECEGGSRVYLLPASEILPPPDEFKVEGELAAGSLVKVKSSPANPSLGSKQPPFLVWSQDGPNYLPLPAQPGSYSLQQGDAQLGSYTVEKAELPRIELAIPPTLPSRSLISIKAVLSNPNTQPIDLSLYRGIRLRTGPECPIEPLEVVLKGKEQRQLQIWLSTPELEEEGSGVAELVGWDGSARELSRFRLRTYRRLPAIGF